MVNQDTLTKMEKNITTKKRLPLKLSGLKKPDHKREVP